MQKGNGLFVLTWILLLSLNLSFVVTEIIFINCWSFHEKTAVCMVWIFFLIGYVIWGFFFRTCWIITIKVINTVWLPKGFVSYTNKSCFSHRWVNFISHISVRNLFSFKEGLLRSYTCSTHFRPLISFYIPWKYQESSSFLETDEHQNKEEKLKKLNWEMI